MFLVAFIVADSVFVVVVFVVTASIFVVKAKLDKTIFFQILKNYNT